MPQISVTIDGKSYRMACAEGEEAHLSALAAELDTRVTGMRKSFGEIGDMRLHVMAALTQADELAELKRRLADLETETAALRDRVESADSPPCRRRGPYRGRARPCGGPDRTSGSRAGGGMRAFGA